MAQERIWRGNDFPRNRVLILGESSYGTYEGDLATDAGWIKAYLEDRVIDRMYTKIANACGMSRKNFWHQIAFTNFVPCVGLLPSARPTKHHYAEAQVRLRELLREIRPRGVWILGQEQGRYSAPIVESAGIVHEIVWHPSRRGTTNAMLGDSWNRLQTKMSPQDDRPTTVLSVKSLDTIDERVCMSHIERATAILDFLQLRRRDGLIKPISNTDLMHEMFGTRKHGKAFGQASSLLDLASLDADLPFIGRLLLFNRPKESDQWANWEPYMTLISLAPRFKFWSDSEIAEIKVALQLRPGSPPLLWNNISAESEMLLFKAVESAQNALRKYADKRLA